PARAAAVEGLSLYNAPVPTGGDDSARRRAAVFLEIHSDLPREGPGDTASTRRAWRMLPNLPPASRVLDVGCGPRAQTVALAAASDAWIVALDTHAPYLATLRARALAACLAARIRAVRASMHDLPFGAQTFDVVWAEGSIYIAGFERALRAWRRVLRPG